MHVTPPAIALAALLAIPASARAQAAGNSLPAVSPDGRQIAYLGSWSGGSALFVIDSNGVNPRRVHLPGVMARLPRWSAGGDLLFAGSGADSNTVFAVSPGGGTPRVVARVPGRSPLLSPDGSRVLYLAGPWTSTALVVARTDGTECRTLAGGRTTAWNGAWSPDGARVAYTYGDSTRLLQVHVVGVNGGNDHALTHTTPEEGSAQMPAWSPDGGRIALQVSNSRTHSSEVWIVELSTGQTGRLSTPGAAYLDEAPAWFPDGTRLAFQSNRTGTMEIWVMAADGSNPRQLTGLTETGTGAPDQPKKP